MKNIKYILFALFVLLAFSCKNSLEATSSTLTCTYNNEEYDYLDGISLNVDEQELAGYFVFKAQHLLDGTVVDKGFEFSSEDVDIIAIDKNTCRVVASEIKYLGDLRVYAKSEIASKFDKTFTISLKSNLKSISLGYTLTNETSLVLDEAYKSGTINSLTKKVSLAKGGCYTLEVVAGEENASIKSIVPKTSDTEAVFFSSVIDNTCLMTITGQEGDIVKITVQVGRSSIKLDFYLEIKDLAEHSISQIVLSSKQEDTLCFLANTDDWLDKSYTYQIKIDDIQDTRNLQFSVQAEEIVAVRDNPASSTYTYKKGDTLQLGTLQAEQYILDNPAEEWQIKKNALWVQEQQFEVKSQDDLGQEQVNFKVNLNANARTLEITPLIDTVWNSNTRNYHLYVYMKFSEDESWRWKYRIMVGGVFESMELYTIENAAETLISQDIEITDDSQVGWTFRVKYTPSTFAENETYFYLADPTNFGKYLIDGEEVSLPKPLGATDNRKNCLSYSSKQEGSATLSGLTLSEYAYFPSNENGYHDIYTNYFSTGEDVKLVWFNKNEKAYISVILKNKQSASVILKSEGTYSDGTYTGYNYIKTVINKSITIKDNSNNFITDTNLTKNYMNSAGSYITSIQEYPRTCTDTLGERRYFLPLNGYVELTISCSFALESVELELDSQGEGKIGYTLSIPKDNSRIAKGSIYCLWKAEIPKNTLSQDDVKSIYLTTEEGCSGTLYLTTESKTYSVPLRFVVYC